MITKRKHNYISNIIDDGNIFVFISTRFCLNFSDSFIFTVFVRYNK